MEGLCEYVSACAAGMVGCGVQKEREEGERKIATK